MSNTLRMYRIAEGNMRELWAEHLALLELLPPDHYPNTCGKKEKTGPCEGCRAALQQEEEYDVWEKKFLSLQRACLAQGLIK